jgi:periplasmic copper chaperone A
MRIPEIIMIRTFVLGAACTLASTACFAHITLETRQAPAGSTYKAVLRVPHGCEGSPTVAVRVKIPEGVFNVKPMPKPGWTIEAKKGKYAKSYDGGHGSLSEGVLELSWTGGKLPDDQYDEFVFRAALAADLPAGKPIYFPVVAECEKGVERWIEIPAQGKKLDDYQFPAAELMITPKK